MPAASAVDRAVRLNRVVFWLMLTGFGLVAVALFVSDVSDLYFFDPPWGDPGAIGGFPVVCWFVLIPVAVTAGLALQTPAVLLLRSGGRVPAALRASGRESGAMIAVLGMLGLLVGLPQEYDGAIVGIVIGGVLFLEGIATVWIAWRAGRRNARAAPSEVDAPGGRRVRFRGQRIAVVLLLGIGWLGDVRYTLPYPQLWVDGRIAVDDIALAQAAFEYDHGRFARDVSELGRGGGTSAITMTETDGVLTVAFRDSVSRRDGLAIGFDHTVRCVAAVTREEPGRATCMPPRPRGATTSDIAPWWVLLTDWFGTLFIGIPLALAAAIAGVIVGRGRVRR